MMKFIIPCSYAIALFLTNLFYPDLLLTALAMFAFSVLSVLAMKKLMHRRTVLCLFLITSLLFIMISVIIFPRIVSDNEKEMIEYSECL